MLAKHYIYSSMNYMEMRWNYLKGKRQLWHKTLLMDLKSKNGITHRNTLKSRLCPLWMNSADEIRIWDCCHGSHALDRVRLVKLQTEINISDVKFEGARFVKGNILLTKFPNFMKRGLFIIWISWIHEQTHYA